jgi:biopolymer transport protein ExbD
VLLIIFMVVTPMLVDGVEVALPETTAPERLPESAGQLDISIRHDGTVYLARNPVPTERLFAALGDVHERSPDQKVVIRADARLPFERVREVMRLVQRAGWRGAGVETRRRESTPDS